MTDTRLSGPMEAGVVTKAVLFDRDGTLVHDVPYNGDPAKVRPMPGARVALRTLRSRGLKVGVVSNQSGLALGRFDTAQLLAVNAEISRRLGPVDVWAICPHAASNGCTYRKPMPGLVIEACSRLGIDPAHAVVVGDIGSDVDAARAAGARAVLVPGRNTRRDEVRAAPVVAADLGEAVALILRGNA